MRFKFLNKVILLILLHILFSFLGITGGSWYVLSLICIFKDGIHIHLYILYMLLLHFLPLRCHNRSHLPSLEGPESSMVFYRTVSNVKESLGKFVISMTHLRSPCHLSPSISNFIIPQGPIYRRSGNEVYLPLLQLCKDSRIHSHLCSSQRAAQKDLDDGNSWRPKSGWTSYKDVYHSQVKNLYTLFTTT